MTDVWIDECNQETECKQEMQQYGSENTRIEDSKIGTSAERFVIFVICVICVL